MKIPTVSPLKIAHIRLNPGDPYVKLAEAFDDIFISSSSMLDSPAARIGKLITESGQKLRPIPEVLAAIQEAKEKLSDYPYKFINVSAKSERPAAEARPLPVDEVLRRIRDAQERLNRL